MLLWCMRWSPMWMPCWTWRGEEKSRQIWGSEAVLGCDSCSSDLLFVCYFFRFHVTHVFLFCQGNLRYFILWIFLIFWLDESLRDRNHSEWNSHGLPVTVVTQFPFPPLVLYPPKLPPLKAMFTGQADLDWSAGANSLALPHVDLEISGPIMSNC